MKSKKCHTRRYEILNTLNMGCSFITPREPCNNKRPRCDIAWPHITNHLYHGCLTFNSENVIEILHITFTHVLQI